MIIWNEPFYFLNIYIRKFINIIIKIMSIILFINKMIKITLQKHFKNDIILINIIKNKGDLKK
jgi:hypothetical protein